MDRGLICHTRAASDRGGGYAMSRAGASQETKTEQVNGKRWQEVLSEEVLEQYDSGVSYKELVEEPEKYQQKTTVVLSGTAEAVSDAQGGSRQVDFQTEDGRLIAYAEDKTGNLEIEQGKEYVICGHFQGMDVSGEVPMVQVLVIEPL